MKTVEISEREFAAIADRDESHFLDIKQSDEGLIERVPGLAGPKSAWRLTKKGMRFNNA